MVIINFLQYDKIILPYFGGPTIEDIRQDYLFYNIVAAYLFIYLFSVRFVANQFALGNDIMLALGQVKDRVAETRVKVMVTGDKRLVEGSGN